jgi:predicted NBD/HSP70 family sugar kinase/antitoxin (DNA-binding transcriptional repressor) of toxin-antitoxin stability system
MKTIGIRELSAASIATAAAEGGMLGITNNGALAGVLAPIDEETVQRMTDRDQASVLASAERAEAELASDERLSTLSELLAEPVSASRHVGGFQRIPIRELSGARLEQAAQAGEALIVTRDRLVVALIVPVTHGWIEDLVEQNIAQFLGTDIAHTSSAGVSPAHVRPSPSLVPRRLLSVGTGAARAGVTLPPSPAGEALRQRAIGIKIISDAPGNRERLVGVMTDVLACIVSGPIEIPLSNMAENEVFAKIITLVDQLCESASGERLLGVGLEIGGHVHKGRVVYSANARWDHFPLAPRLSDSLGLPVVLENDANALAMHERWFRGIDDECFAVVLITHLGVGCSLVLDGRVYHGVHGMAGELGHIPVEFGDRETKKCRCDNPGCLEGAATPNAIALTLPEFGFSSGYDTALEDPHNETVETVFGQAGAAMGRAVSMLINLFNPSAVIFHAPTHLLGSPRSFRIESEIPASGVARPYVGAMTRAMREHAFSTAAEDCRFIVRTSEDEDGAAAAAACLIRHVGPPSVTVNGGK